MSRNHAERGTIYRILDWPPLYELVQRMMAPGAHAVLPRKIRTWAGPDSGRVLDVGCGPDSWLARAGARPVGLDIRAGYVARHHESLRSAVVGSGMQLPFASRSFDQAWSIGVLHHLGMGAATAFVGEMMRVVRVGGAVIVLDSVLPDPACSRPIASLTRRLDRGGMVRTQAALASLLPASAEWTTVRFTYTFTGLEMLLCRAVVE